MLNLSTLLIVLGSKQTHSLPLGFLTRTKLCTQSVASLMSNLWITPYSSILSISHFNGSTMAWGILHGGWTTGSTSGLMSRITSASFIVPMPSNNSGKSSKTCALQSCLSLVLTSTGGRGGLTFALPGSNPLGNSAFKASTAIYLQTQLSLQLTVTKLNALQNCKPNMTLVSTRLVT